MIEFFSKFTSESTWYKNCVKNRKASAKCCDDCPFKDAVERFEFELGRERKSMTDLSVPIWPEW